jgi:hypothetical protein
MCLSVSSSSKFCILKNPFPFLDYYRELLRAQRRILSCEECNPEAAEFPFDTVLDELTGSDPSITDMSLDVS